MNPQIGDLVTITYSIRIHCGIIININTIQLGTTTTSIVIDLIETDGDVVTHGFHNNLDKVKLIA